MTDKEFKRLNRNELVEIIYEYQKREAAMQAEINSLKAQLSFKEQQLADTSSVADSTEQLQKIISDASSLMERSQNQITAQNAMLRVLEGIICQNLRKNK